MKKVTVKIEVSARHIHLSKKDLDKLFGSGYQLKKLKPLSQEGEFAAKEKISLKSKGGEISLRVVGPVRDNTQIELSRTDARELKINPPLRLSGDIKGSFGGLLIGPKGKVKLKEGIIIAKRHLHCDGDTAKKLNLKNNQKVSVMSIGERSVIFNEVLVRVKENFNLAIHIDTDEANASLPESVCTSGYLIIKK